ncbi:MAG: sigma-70 family RNA polymerase sigma factor [Armatimonadetes bacterium]|nr:sigma-70 family RNA polymerase sigma factor [Armatimonadota bacterium]
MPFDESDRHLVERVKEGDVRAFEMLHRRYYPRIYRLAFLRLGNAEDAADVASETFRRALNRISSFEFRRTSSLYPWLHQIASNLVVDVVRALPPGGTLSLDAHAAEEIDSFLEYLPAEGPSPQELVERAEVQELVREAIKALPPDQCRALTLRFLGDLSIREIAQTLDRSEGAVKSLLHRALQGMRQQLKSSLVASREQAEAGYGVASRRGEGHDAEVVRLRRGGA